MTLLVDNRTGSRDLYPILTHCCSHRVQLTRLQSGDVSWVGQGPDDMPVTVGVERKRIADLISSKDSGRLTGTQLANMRNHFEYGYVVVEGIWRPDDDGLLCTWRGKRKGMRPLAYGARQYTVKEVYKFLNTMAVKLGVMLWRTASAQETAMWVAAMYGWWQKSFDRHKSHRQKTKVKATLKLGTGKASRLARMLQEFDGVGMEKAEGIAKHYASIGQMLSGASVEDLAGIVYGKRKDGAKLHVGKITAEKIIRQIWEEEEG